jgi:hypothetical protein
MNREFYIQRAIESLQGASRSRDSREREKWVLEAVAWHDLAKLAEESFLPQVKDWSSPTRLGLRHMH